MGIRAQIALWSSRKSAAGRVADLYKAVAKVLSLSAEAAQQLLLLAEYTSNQTLTMHTKGSEPLSTVQVSNGPGHFSSSKPLLLAYHYASASQGPSSGKQLLVYNRSALHTLFCSLFCAKLSVKSLTQQQYRVFS